MNTFWNSMKGMGNMTFGKGKYEGQNNWKESMGLFHSLSFPSIQNKEVKFSQFENKVCLITNVACKCGYTQKSHEAMQNLSVQYNEKGTLHTPSPSPSHTVLSELANKVSKCYVSLPVNS